MNANTYSSYFNDFVTQMTISLKSGWGIQMAVYPFEAGAVIVVTLKRDAPHAFEKKKEVKTLGDALIKTALFSSDKIAPLADKKIKETVIGIASLTKYVIFKNVDDDQWNQDAAIHDVEEIIKRVKAKS